MVYDVWLTGYTQSSPEPLTSPFYFSLPLFSSFLYFSERVETWGGGTSRVKCPQAVTCSKEVEVTGKQRPFRWTSLAGDTRPPVQITLKLMYSSLHSQHHSTQLHEYACVCTCLCVSEELFQSVREKRETNWQVSKHKGLKSSSAHFWKDHACVENIPHKSWSSYRGKFWTYKPH